MNWDIPSTFDRHIGTKGYGIRYRRKSETKEDNVMPIIVVTLRSDNDTKTVGVLGIFETPDKVKRMALTHFNLVKAINILTFY